MSEYSIDFAGDTDRTITPSSVIYLSGDFDLTIVFTPQAENSADCAILGANTALYSGTALRITVHGATGTYKNKVQVLADPAFDTGFFFWTSNTVNFGVQNTLRVYRSSGTVYAVLNGTSTTGATGKTAEFTFERFGGLSSTTTGNGLFKLHSANFGTNVYACNEGSGTTVYDSVGSKNLTLNNFEDAFWVLESGGEPTLTPVEVGHALTWAVREEVDTDHTISWVVESDVTPGAVFGSFLGDLILGGPLDVSVVTLQSVNTSYALTWAVREEVDTGHVLTWAVREEVDTGHALTWAVREEVDTGHTLTWAVREEVDTDYSIIWTYGSQVQQIHTLTWAVREEVDVDHTLTWAVREEVGTDHNITWAAHRFVEQSFVTSWSVREEVEVGHDITWAVESEVVLTPVEVGHSLTWAVREEVDTGHTLTWASREEVDVDHTISWAVESEVVLSPVEVGHTLNWSVRQQVTNELSLSWAVREAVSRGHTIFWVVEGDQFVLPRHMIKILQQQTIVPVLQQQTVVKVNLNL